MVDKEQKVMKKEFKKESKNSKNENTYLKDLVKNIKPDDYKLPYEKLKQKYPYMILNVVRENLVSVSVYSPIDIDLVKLNPKALNTNVRDDLIKFLKQRIKLGSKYY